MTLAPGVPAKRAICGPGRALTGMGEMVHEPRRTLAARLEDRDRGRFAGRAAELAFLEQCMGEESPVSVVHVCGPGGIGKSALLREAARRARSRGIDVVAVDGRQLGPAPGALEAALRGAVRYACPVVLLDSYERMLALDRYLRHDLLPTLPDRTLVVIAGRATPDPAWFAGGWETVTTRLEVGALPPADAQVFLAARGVRDERVLAIIEWAEGSPLALALAADAATADARWNPDRGAERPEIFSALIHRLVEPEVSTVKLSALAMATVARTTTPQLLAAVLPHGDAEEAYRQLCELTVSEPLGEGIALHELVRKALHADLRLRNSELERDLRRRIVDYLYERAIDNRSLLMIDMAHLVENPLIRWGFGWVGNIGVRIDSIRRDDAERLAQSLCERPNHLWWDLTRRFFDESPDRVAVVRDLNDAICGYMACVSTAIAPSFAYSDPLLGPWLAHAHANLALGDSVLWHAAVDFTGQGRVQAMLGLAGVLRSGVANPRFAYLPIDPAYRGALDFARALGADHLAELDTSLDGQEVQCFRLDHGPGGLLASLRAQVYHELGLPAPARSEEQPASSGAHGQSQADALGTEAPAASAASAPTPGEAAVAAAGTPTADRAPQATRAQTGVAPSASFPSAAADLEAVRDALRNFQVPRDLARSPLAQGATVQERAEFVRKLLRTAAAQAFGDSESEKLLHSVLVAGYLEPARSHEAAAAKLCLSRAAYFRRLRTAVERLAEHMALSP